MLNVNPASLMSHLNFQKSEGRSIPKTTLLGLCPVSYRVVINVFYKRKTELLGTYSGSYEPRDKKRPSPYS